MHRDYNSVVVFTAFQGLQTLQLACCALQDPILLFQVSGTLKSPASSIISFYGSTPRIDAQCFDHVPLHIDSECEIIVTLEQGFRAQLVASFAQPERSLTAQVSSCICSSAVLEKSK